MLALLAALHQILVFAPIATTVAAAPSEVTKAQSQTCFDFTKKISGGLHEPPTDFTAKTDSGQIKLEKRNLEKVDFAQVSGKINRPILELYQALLDPKTIRNSDNTRVTVTEKPSPHFLKLIDQSISVNVKFLFSLKIEWHELWAYSLLSGTPTQPKSILISYEKTEGTSHIHHFCGNIFLKSLTPKQTGVFIDEQIKADQRSAKDLLSDIQGTFKTLENKP